MNYSTMTAKELKIAARDAKVKNWWNLSKADLIVALTPADVTIEGVASIVVNFATGEVTLKMICDRVNVTPKKARKILRKAYGARYCRWVFIGAEVNQTLAILSAVQ